jgi:hypothetical protein
MAATNGVNDQVRRWQRELRGYRLRFQKPEDQELNARERRRSDARAFGNAA